MFVSSPIESVLIKMKSFLKDRIGMLLLKNPLRKQMPLSLQDHCLLSINKNLKGDITGDFLKIISKFQTHFLSISNFFQIL